MSRPWMPLYVADYLRDTRRLTAAEHGAYLLLIMEYWTAGELPDDDKQLSRIACMSGAEWRKAKPNIQPHFLEDWKGHKRIDSELAKSADISSKRSASAKLKHSKSSANAEQVDTHAGATSQSPRQDAAPAASVDLETDLFRRGKEVLGNNAGGLIAQLLKSKSGKITDARAAIETAAGKQNPREYIGGVIRKPTSAEPAWLDGIPGVL